ncbi:MAG: adenylate/guanylate cyclase domain-containing protein [Pseudomonadota bacterium]
MDRRLAAIVLADVVGYSRLVEADETRTLEALKKRRTEILQPLVDGHKGRIVKLMGDGILMEFASAVSAVRCAVELQAAMAAANAPLSEDEKIVLRVGISLGDVVVEDADIYGDGVNVAARLEAIADPGGICVSDTIHHQVQGKVDLRFDDLGERSLKNIAAPVRVYRLRGENALKAPPALALPDRPSIAVLPFQNMSGDPEQDYFADGIVEDIITALSRVRWLFVIARNSSQIYKGRSIDIRQAGRELGVRYVLEGSVRKAASRVRITGQLIDASTAAHLWADRYDGQMEDVFDLQDQITASVVAAIAPKMEVAEIDRSRRKPTENLDAYDHYLRGMASVHLWTEESNRDALAHFYKAIELDPKYAAAYGLAARCYSQRKAGGWTVDLARETAEAARLARLAVEFGGDDAVALCTAGIAQAYLVGDLDEGHALTELALAQNPNFAWAWVCSGWVNLWRGEIETAMERLNHAIRMSPNDPSIFVMHDAMASACFCAGRYPEALQWATKALRSSSEFLLTQCLAAASGAHLGRVEEARDRVTRLLKTYPSLRISDLKAKFPEFSRPEMFARFADGLRQAGLPD